MRPLCWLLALLLACDKTGSKDPILDLDDDGYGSDEDCDDQSAAISPDADERCNGIDDDCDGLVDEAGAVDGAPGYADQDGDGYGAGDAALYCSSSMDISIYPGDCDDADPEISPLGTELCNGIDDDCDGLVDEPGTPDGLEYPLDQDGDGYGHPVLTGVACAPTDGFAEDASDCDDGDPSRHPDAPEDCVNGVDDDCDGVVDETDDASTPTWYLDGDGDGYGGADGSASSCAPPAGYVATVSDCDDGDPAVHPNLADPTDGIDNDCDGEVDEVGDMQGEGELTYEQSAARGSGCELVWTTTWTEIYPAPLGDYAWHVEHAWDEAASRVRNGCSYPHVQRDFAWDVALIWHSAWGPEVLWVREEGDSMWLPRFHSAFNTGNGHLRFSADLGTTTGDGGTTISRTIKGDVYLSGL